MVYKLMLRKTSVTYKNILAIAANAAPYSEQRHNLGKRKHGEHNIIGQ